MRRKVIQICLTKIQTPKPPFSSAITRHCSGCECPVWYQVSGLQDTRGATMLCIECYKRMGLEKTELTPINETTITKIRELTSGLGDLLEEYERKEDENGSTGANRA